MILKVLSWNIWIDGYFDKIAEFLEKSQADIIGLQEVKSDDPERDVIRYLTGLGYHYVFFPVKHEWEWRIYNDAPAIFSKYEIQGTKIHTLSEIEKRFAVEADIAIGDTTLHVFSAHLLHTHQQPSTIQDAQVDNLIKILPAQRVVVMGDFNATPESAVIRKMRNFLVDTDPQSTPTWSVYPEGCSTCNPQAVDTRLDYIFVSEDIKTDAFRVEQSAGSDHVPISVRIEI